MKLHKEGDWIRKQIVNLYSAASGGLDFLGKWSMIGVKELAL